MMSSFPLATVSDANDSDADDSDAQDEQEETAVLVLQENIREIMARIELPSVDDDASKQIRDLLQNNFGKLLSNKPYSMKAATSPRLERHIKKWANPDRTEIAQQYISSMNEFGNTFIQFYQTYSHLFPPFLVEEIRDITDTIDKHGNGGTKKQQSALSDKRWTLENWKETVTMEMAFQSGLPVLALCDSDDTWTVELLFGYEYIVVPEVPSELVRTKITKLGMQKIAQLGSDRLFPVGKYKVSLVTKEVVPRKCRMLQCGTWEVQDMYGAIVSLEGGLDEDSVPRSFVNMCMNAANQGETRWFVVPPGRRVKQHPKQLDEQFLKDTRQKQQLDNDYLHKDTKEFVNRQQGNLDKDIQLLLPSLPPQYGTSGGKTAHLCLYGALASAIYLFGDVKLSQLVWEISKDEQTISFNRMAKRVPRFFKKLFNKKAMENGFPYAVFHKQEDKV